MPRWVQAKLICHMGEQHLLRVLVPRGPAVVRGKQEPHGHGPACPGRRAGTSEVRGEQDPCGHSSASPGRRAGALLWSGASRIPVDMGEQCLLRALAPRGPAVVRGKQEPHGHGPMCPGRRAGDL